MDEIEQRLRSTSDACIGSYDTWRKNPKDSDARENLLEAVHELRKVAARLEIELAVSERDEMAARPIPIPPHRSSRKQQNNNGDDNIGNSFDDSNDAVGNVEGGNSTPRERSNNNQHRRRRR